MGNRTFARCYRLVCRIVEGGITFNKIFHDFLIFNRGYESADYIIPASWYLEIDLKMMLEIPIIIVV